ncbi:hydroxymethylglutaryl-coenzyme A reductase family protein [Penicillium frequentans]|uniref:Hydroxymethylglutaryl-coenzyme A reductase family protein n=1 Tax=Penicillium frequentans TaxID=3151616 RepID=A0AAD6CZ89_9EURO|nr:hydroxymethylglutaryl-coenzyme A reductase family protein [Penicillium glabrum]
MGSPTGVTSKLKHITQDGSTIKNAKIENYVGSVRVPVGIAGPLRVKGPEGIDGDFHAPFGNLRVHVGSKLFPRMQAA